MAKQGLSSRETSVSKSILGLGGQESQYFRSTVLSMLLKFGVSPVMYTNGTRQFIRWTSSHRYDLALSGPVPDDTLDAYYHPKSLADVFGGTPSTWAQWALLFSDNNDLHAPLMYVSADVLEGMAQQKLVSNPSSKEFRFVSSRAAAFFIAAQSRGVGSVMLEAKALLALAGVDVCALPETSKASESPVAKQAALGIDPAISDLDVLIGDVLEGSAPVYAPHRQPSPRNMQVSDLIGVVGNVRSYMDRINRQAAPRLPQQPEHAAPPPAESMTPAPSEHVTPVPSVTLEDLQFAIQRLEDQLVRTRQQYHQAYVQQIVEQTRVVRVYPNSEWLRIRLPNGEERDCVFGSFPTE